MKYGLIVLMAMVSLRLVHGAESLEREEPVHPADAVAIATYANSIIEEGDFFGVHPDVQVRALETFTDSVVFKDDTRTEIIRIKLKGSLDRTGVTQLWQMLSYILEHPEQIGFRWARTSELLEIDKLDIDPLNREDPQFNILMLALANLKELTVHIRSDHALEQLIYVLRQCGNLEQLTILDINNRSLFERLSVVFRQHINLKHLKLSGIEKKHLNDVLPASPGEPGWGRVEIWLYSPILSVTLPDIFSSLGRLETLVMHDINVKAHILEVLSNLPMLRKLELGYAGLEESVINSIFTISRQHPLLEEIRIIPKMESERIEEKCGYRPGGITKKVSGEQYNGKVYYPKEDKLR